jgi:hypothetical protein
MAATKVERLEALRTAATPETKSAVAAGLLDPRHGLEVVRAALSALIAWPEPAARPALCRLFDHYAENGVRRDPGAYVRSQILRALRPIALPADVALALRAANTYEYPPPAFKEEAALLRAGALVLLADLDDDAARYEATRLLADGRTDPMSGEPARSAVEALASLDEALPLLFYAMQPVERIMPEVGAGCLQRLTGLPSAALSSVLAHYAECSQPVLLVGVVELLLHTEGGAEGMTFLARQLQQPPDLDFYRYLVAALLAAPQPALRTLLAESVRLEQNQARVEVLLELLSDSPEPGWAELIATLRARRRRRV